jgi:tRNA U34 5-methylaminomethyl-2-thiouridine-forming methyltransferase MnmC
MTNFTLIPTADGSKTVYHMELDEHFKSPHACAIESEEVFIRPCIWENPHYVNTKPLNILELGFGIGANFRSLICHNVSANFVSIDCNLEAAHFYEKSMGDELLKGILTSRKGSVRELKFSILEGHFHSILPELLDESFDVVFFDPFSPLKNPSCWTPEIFSHVFRKMTPGGRLATYSVSRIAKDSAMQAGFHIEKRSLPTVLKKRSSLLAIKKGSLRI